MKVKFEIDGKTVSEFTLNERNSAVLEQGGYLDFTVGGYEKEIGFSTIEVGEAISEQQHLRNREKCVYGDDKPIEFWKNVIGFQPIQWKVTGYSDRVCGMASEPKKIIIENEVVPCRILVEEPYASSKGDAILERTVQFILDKLNDKGNE